MLKVALLVLALCLVAYGQQNSADPCSEFNEEQCFANIGECGFCTRSNQESGCVSCEGGDTCVTDDNSGVTATWNGNCECHTDEKVCERNLTPIQPGTKPAQANCKWCDGNCHNPLTSSVCCAKDLDACKESRECSFCESKQQCVDSSDPILAECEVQPDVCSKKTDVECKESQDCLYCEDKQACFTNDNQGHADCEKPDDTCDAVCLAVIQPVCGSDGNTYNNICELEKKRDCKILGAGDLKKVHDGPCCGDSDTEDDCKLNEKCQFCDGKCKELTATGCEAFNCLVAGATREKCSELSEKGCEWCADKKICLDKENIGQCEQTIDCGKIEKKDDCRASRCFWCETEAFCKSFDNVNPNVVAGCSCFGLATTEEKCDALGACEWCPQGKTCLSKDDFPKERCFINIDPPTCLASTNFFGEACEIKGAANDVSCKYCAREGVCIPADTPENDIPKFCDCGTDDEGVCGELDGCHWCKDTCVLKKDIAEKCLDTPCSELSGDQCTGECSICETDGRCYAESRKPKYCYCEKIENQRICESIGDGLIRGACSWCQDDANSDKGQCVRGTQCDPGQGVACSRNLEEDECKTCFSSRTWSFCPNVGCIPGDTCDKPDVCPDPADSPIPIVECVRKLNTKIGVACLGSDTPNERVELAVNSAHNTLVDAMIDNSNLPSIFESGRSRQYPACFFRVEFELTKKPRWCICDRCVDIDTTRLCPAPKWKIIFKGVLADADLINKIKVWFKLKFPNIDLEDIIIKILQATTKRQDTTSAEISVAGDKVTDTDVAAIDDGLSDPSLADAVGAEVQGVQTTGSGVSQTGSSQTTNGQSSSNVIVVGLALLLALVGLLL